MKWTLNAKPIESRTDLEILFGGEYFDVKVIDDLGAESDHFASGEESTRAGPFSYTIGEISLRKATADERRFMKRERP